MTERATSKCDSCKVKYTSDTDSRWLPCLHVFCMSRLKTDYNRNRELRCINCGYFYNSIIIETERQPSVSNSLSLSISSELNRSLSIKEYRCQACDRKCSSMGNPCLPWLGCLEVFCALCLQEKPDRNDGLSCLHCGIFYGFLSLDLKKSNPEQNNSASEQTQLISNYSNRTTRDVWTDSSGDSRSNGETIQSQQSSAPAPLSLSKDLNICDLNLNGVNGTPRTRVCDLAGCYSEEVVGFCVQCEHKLCLTHLQTHIVHFRDQHEIVSREIYDRCPGKYTKPRCKYHSDEILVKACKKCDKLICNRCDIYSEDCSDHQHNFRNFEELSEEVQSHYNELRNNADHRIAEIRKLEREAYTKLGLERKRCKEKLREIERFCHEQVKQIFDQCQKAKLNVQQYQEEIADEVEAYISRLMDNRESVEHLSTRVEELMRDHHIAERIRCKQDTAGSLSKNIQTVIERLELETKKALIMRVNPLSLRINLVKIPSRLKLETVYDVRSYCCLSVSHGEDGSLMVGTEDGLKLIDKSRTRLAHHKIFDHGFISATVCKGEIYVRGANENVDVNDERDIRVLSVGTESVKSLFRMRGTSLSISISDNYAATLSQPYCPDSERTYLILYNLQTQQSQVIHTSISFQRICFHPDGHLLATYGEDKLGKFYLEDGQLNEVWSRNGFDSECCMRVNTDGLIYVCCFTQQTIYIISPTNGETVQKLFNKDLPTDILGSVSLHGDELAVPGWRSGKVYMFNFK